MDPLLGRELLEKVIPQKASLWSVLHQISEGALKFCNIFLMIMTYFPLFWVERSWLSYVRRRHWTDAFGIVQSTFPWSCALMVSSNVWRTSVPSEKQWLLTGRGGYDFRREALDILLWWIWRALHRQRQLISQMPCLIGATAPIFS